MIDIVLKKLDEVYYRIQCDESIARELKEHFSFYANNFQFHPKFRRKIWNGKIGFFDIRERKLPIGLTKDFFGFCKKHGYKFHLDFDTTDMIDSDIQQEDIVSFCDNVLQTKMKPRDYQVEAIHSALKHKRGVIVSSVGSGKSFMQYIVSRMIMASRPDTHILMIVPSVSLVSQMYSDFMAYGWDLEERPHLIYSGQDKHKESKVTISTWQSLYEMPESFFLKFDTVLVDEVHLAKAVSLQGIMKKCSLADYRLGFTGTMPTHKADATTILAMLGHVVFEQLSRELMDIGVLSKMNIVSTILEYPMEERLKQKDRPYQEEVDFIAHYPNRMKAIDFVMKGATMDGKKENVMILCTLIDQLKEVEIYLNKMYGKQYKIKTFHGEISAKEREEIRKEMDSRDAFIMVASYQTASTGINIKRIHNVVLFSSYKSKIKVLQSIGRGLRTHETKEKLIVYDVVDDMRLQKRTGSFYENHTFKHWKERLGYYHEQGFDTFEKNIEI